MVLYVVYRISNRLIIIVIILSQFAIYDACDTEERTLHKRHDLSSIFVRKWDHRRRRGLKVYRRKLSNEATIY